MVEASRKYAPYDKTEKQELCSLYAVCTLYEFHNCCFQSYDVNNEDIIGTI